MVLEICCLIEETHPITERTNAAEEQEIPASQELADIMNSGFLALRMPVSAAIKGFQGFARVKDFSDILAMVPQILCDRKADLPQTSTRSTSIAAAWCWRTARLWVSCNSSCASCTNFVGPSARLTPGPPCGSSSLVAIRRTGETVSWPKSWPSKGTCRYCRN